MYKHELSQASTCGDVSGTVKGEPFLLIDSWLNRFRRCIFIIYANTELCNLDTS